METAPLALRLKTYSTDGYVIFPLFKDNKGYDAQNIYPQYLNNPSGTSTLTAFAILCKWLSTHTVHISKMYVKSNNALQFDYPIVIEKENILGEGKGRDKVLVKDPYQRQNNIIVVNENFILNRNNRLKITVPAHTITDVYLYPDKIESYVGDNTEYEMPKITKNVIV